MYFFPPHLPPSVWHFCFGFLHFYIFRKREILRHGFAQGHLRSCSQKLEKNINEDFSPAALIFDHCWFENVVALLSLDFWPPVLVAVCDNSRSVRDINKIKITLPNYFLPWMRRGTLTVVHIPLPTGELVVKYTSHNPHSTVCGSMRQWAVKTRIPLPASTEARVRRCISGRYRGIHYCCVTISYPV